MSTIALKPLGKPVQPHSYDYYVYKAGVGSNRGHVDVELLVRLEVLDIDTEFYFANAVATKSPIIPVLAPLLIAERNFRFQAVLTV